MTLNEPVHLQGRSASLTFRKVARDLARNRHRLGRVHMLTGSRFVKLTADFVRRFAGLGDMMVLYDDPSVFEETLEAATHVASLGRMAR